jgi:hypothetical protein
MTVFDVELAARTRGPAAVDRSRGAAVPVVDVASRPRFSPPTDSQDGGRTAAAEKRSLR